MVAARLERRLAPALGQPQDHVQVGGRQPALAPLRPLDQTERLLGEQVTAADELQFLGIAQAIEVEMMHQHSVQLIGLHQGIGRALHRAPMTTGAQDAACQGGLAGSQLAAEMHATLLPQGTAQAFAEGNLAFFVIESQQHRLGPSSG